MVGSDWVRGALLGFGAVVLSVSCGGSLNDEPSPRATGASAGQGASAGEGQIDAGDAAVGGSPAVISPRGRKDGVPLLGQACARDADCGDDGLRCLGADEDYDQDYGAPPHGMCTAACEDNVSCLAFDEHAVCGTMDEAPLDGGKAEEPAKRFCMLGCTPGISEGDAKCHGRQDMACRPFAPVDAASCEQGDPPCADGTFCFRGVCRAMGCGPRCNADADCIAGRYCDPGWGVCISEEPERPVIGEACLGDAATEPECGLGICLDTFRNAGTTADPRPVSVREACTQSCTLGSSCGEGTGACVSPRLNNYGPGDAGYCLQKCNCNSDCKNPSDRCRPWSADSAQRFGSQGVCDYAFGGAPSIDCDDATNGGAGGGGGAGGSN